MLERRERIRHFFTDRRIVLILRWWSAGAVYFFIGWGTSLGNQASMIDFVFSLGIAMGVFNMLIVNPGLGMAFNVGKRRVPGGNTISQRVSDYLVAMLKNILIMFVIALIYVGLNSAINAAFGLPASNISLPGEPILFGVFYVLVFVLFGRIWQRLTTTFNSYQNRNK
ncbi:MAG: hypothetical protein ACPG8W_02780 [Candidatus Promineifilaceae bacterium]